MTTQNIFEIAVKGKFRFPYKGLVSTEDLWDLSVESLDAVFKSLNSQVKQVQEESLLHVKTNENKELDVKIEIIKYIVSEKLAAKEAQLKAKEQRENKQKIQQILFTKENEELQKKSSEELRAMLEDLK